MTRKVTINVDSLISFLTATHGDLLTVNVALHHSNEKVTANATKVCRHRIERIRTVLMALDLGENLIGLIEEGTGE